MSTPPIAQSQILIVDDEHTTRDLLEIILSSEGYATLVAPSLEEAGALWRTQRVDLVLTDLLTHRAPASLDVIRRLRDQVAPCPVGVVTEWSLDTEEVERLGFAFLVRKPFDLDYLLLNVAAGLSLPLGPEQEHQAAVVRRYFTALTNRDWDALLDLCHEDVTYVLPPPAPFAATLHGKAAFRQYTEETFRHFPAARFADVEVYATPQGLAARYAASWQAPEGQEMHQNGAVVFAFAGALIMQIGSLVDAEGLRGLLRGQATDMT